MCIDIVNHWPTLPTCKMTDHLLFPFQVGENLSDVVKWLHKGTKMSADTVRLMEQIAVAFCTMQTQLQQGTMFAGERSWSVARNWSMI